MKAEFVCLYHWKDDPRRTCVQLAVPSSSLEAWGWPGHAATSESDVVQPGSCLLFPELCCFCRYNSCRAPCIGQEPDELLSSIVCPSPYPSSVTSSLAQGMWLISSEGHSLIRRKSCPGDSPQGLICKDVPELRGLQTHLNSSNELVGAKSHLYH